MNANDPTLVMAERELAKLSPEDQAKVLACITEMNTLGEKYGARIFTIVIALGGLIFEKEVENHPEL